MCTLSNATCLKTGVWAGRDTRGVSDAMAAALASDLPAHGSSPSSASVRSTLSGGAADSHSSPSSWHPRGILVAHLAEHR